MGTNPVPIYRTMPNILTKLAKNLTPPLVVRILSPKGCPGRILFRGDYPSWDQAKQNSQGYETGFILEKVKRSMEQVRDGKAVYERDSVLFDHVEFPFPLLAALLRAAASDGRLNVLDIGGSLGSSYYQCRRWLSALSDLRWNIVEQPAFVQAGQKHFQNDQLRFYPDIASCLKEQSINLVLMSSVLSYLEFPHHLLNEVIGHGFKHIILDRTPVLPQPGRDRLTVQEVPAHIYGNPVTYPAWFFDRDRLMSHFSGTYDLLTEFNAVTGRFDLGDAGAFDKGFVFQRLPADSIKK